jgi:hypothetical protein
MRKQRPAGPDALVKAPSAAMTTSERVMAERNSTKLPGMKQIESKQRVEMMVE